MNEENKGYNYGSQPQGNYEKTQYQNKNANSSRSSNMRENNYWTPEEIAPVMTTTQWLGALVLAAIPFINIIFMLVWSFDQNANPNRRNWAKATLLIMVVGILFTVLFYLFIFAAIAGTAGGMLKSLNL